MAQELIVTGRGWDSPDPEKPWQSGGRLEVGPAASSEAAEKHGRVVEFGMGAEVLITPNFDRDASGRVLEATISQGGIGGQDLETARTRAAAFSLAVQVAERITDRLAGGASIANAVSLELGSYRIDGRYVYSKS